MSILDTQREHSISISLRELPDTLLAQQTLEGDHRAFEILIQRYRSPLFKFICRFLEDYDQASEILQLAFLRFYTSLFKLDKEAPFKPWLFQVARNCCIDELRRRRHLVTFSQLEDDSRGKEQVRLDEIVDRNPSPEDIIERYDLRSLLHNALAQLTPRSRRIIVLRLVSHLSFAEIAQSLKMREGTVKTAFYRARALLVQILLAQKHADLGGSC